MTPGQRQQIHSEAIRAANQARIRAARETVAAPVAPTTPGGSDTQVQFNDGGAFAGDAGLTWDKTGNKLNIGAAGDPFAGAPVRLVAKSSAGDGVSLPGYAMALLNSDGAVAFAVGENTTDTKVFVQCGDTDGATNGVFFRMDDGGVPRCQFSAPMGQCEFGDRAGMGNLTEFIVDDANQVVTSNVPVEVPDDAYGAGWNGSLEVPTKNAVYDKIETLSGGSGLTHPQVLARSLGA